MLICVSYGILIQW